MLIDVLSLALQAFFTDIIAYRSFGILWNRSQWNLLDALFLFVCPQSANRILITETGQGID